MFIGSNCISWHAKKQSTIARSNTEAEYRSIAIVAFELTWIVSLICDANIFLKNLPTLLCNNLSGLYLTTNFACSYQTYRNRLSYFVREKVAKGTLVIKYVPA